VVCGRGYHYNDIIAAAAAIMRRTHGNGRDFVVDRKYGDVEVVDRK